MWGAHVESALDAVYYSILRMLIGAELVRSRLAHCRQNNVVTLLWRCKLSYGLRPTVLRPLAAVGRFTDSRLPKQPPRVLCMNSIVMEPPPFGNNFGRCQDIHGNILYHIASDEPAIIAAPADQ